RVHSAPSYMLLKADAAQTLGASFAAHARVLAIQQQIVEQLKQSPAGSETRIPATLTQAATDLPTTLEQANSTYQVADQTLQSVLESPAASRELQGAAHVMRALTLHGLAQVEQRMNQEQQANQHLQLARQAIAQAREANARIPVLPADL